jgi:hypothetical protein
MFKSGDAAAFFAAWRDLREIGHGSEFKVPHYRSVFQQLPPEMLPRLAVVEETQRGEYVIRFMGTWRVEIWGKDLTGGNPLALMSPALVQSARRNMETVLEHPCGMYFTAQYVTPSGREVLVENITLPAGNDPGLPRRIVNFVDELSTTGYGDTVGALHSIGARAWLDIGAGVPKKLPVK